MTTDTVIDGSIDADIATSPEVAAVLAQLRAAGERRAGVNRHRLGGPEQLQRSTQDICAYAAEARRLGLTQEVIAEAIGVSRKRLWEITTGRAKL